MAEHNAEWRSKLYAILPHPTEVRILMLPEGSAGSDGATWTLPLTTVSQRVWFLHLGWVTELMREKLGAHLTALRYVDFVTDEVEHSVTGIYVLENRGGDAVSPPGGRWVGREGLLTLAVPEQRTAIEAHFGEIESGDVPDQRPPWARTGWYDQVERWLEEQVVSMGYTLVAPIEQIRVWGLSCVLRAQTSQGDFYFKCGARLPLAANEPRLMAALSSRFPEIVPAPVRMRFDPDWMLLPDFGSQLAWEAPPETLGAAYRSLAEVQIALSSRIDELLAMGCPDRRMDKMLAHIDFLMEGLPDIQGLDQAEVRRLRALSPRLKAMCRQLEDLGLPDCLVHGDFYAGNIAIQDHKTLIFDWAEGCVAHPFFDMLDLFEKEAAGPQTHLRDSYLAPWKKGVSEEKLLAAWALAPPLAALHTAISSYHIVTHLEDASKGQLAWAVPRWLRLLLRLVADG